ncbi:MAG TPA: RuBisCO large subunit C-terminal-like domain-containing protein [Methylocystis sp.]|nr:RuBisCO large subunit C-terminal-like domain-containing protein [Methylocystis sp.]
MDNIIAHYRLRAADAREAADRAQKIAVEQSVECPLKAVRDPRIRDEIVGKVLEIRPAPDGLFDIIVELCAETVGRDAGQLINMLFGNTSMHADVSLEDAEIPERLLDVFAGPNHGLEGVRELAGAARRPMTCSALKPQGMAPRDLAALAREFARGGVDFIKDDHGLADQDYSPFAERVPACAAAMREAERETGRLTHYIPSLWGSFEEIDRRLELAAREGLRAAMLAPALIGASDFVALKRKHSRFAFFAHPSFTGGARISPQLYNKLYRIFGADAVIFPTFGGRFGYSKETCRAIAKSVRDPLGRLRPAAPVPAGGLTLARVAETLDFYGPDTMLLIGGDLLLAELNELAGETAAFVRAVETHQFGES